MYLRINTNSSCNISCKHCYYKEKVWFDWKTLKLNDAKQIIEQAYCIWWTKLNIVIMWWWEPLLYFDLLELIKYINKKNIPISITTNWLLLTDELLKEFKKYNVLLNISLEGNKKYNDFIRWKWTFQHLIKNISKVINYQIRYSINFVLTKNNILQIPFIIKLFNDTSEYITFSRYIPYIENKELQPLEKKDYLVIDKILDKYKNKKLKYRQENFLNNKDSKKDFLFNVNELKSLYILPDLRVFPAWNLLDYELWNLEKLSLKEILLNWKYEKLINPDNLNWNFCKTCIKKYNCWWDRWVAHFYTWNIWWDDPQCPFYK